MQMPDPGELLDQMVPMSGCGGLMEGVLQGPCHGRLGGLERVCLWLNLPVAHHGVDMLWGTEPTKDAIINGHGVVTRC